MKVNYKNCEIECYRDHSPSGDILLYYDIFDEDGYEVTSGFTIGEDTIKDYIGYLKNIVDDYIEIQRVMSRSR